MKTTLLEKLKKEGSLERIANLGNGTILTILLASFVINLLIGFMLAICWGQSPFLFMLFFLVLILTNMMFGICVNDWTEYIWRFKREVS